MDMTPLQISCWRVSFFDGLRVVLLQLYSETTWAVGIAQLTHHEVQGGGKKSTQLTASTQLNVSLWWRHNIYLS